MNIFITGASRGIGFETASILAADGHRVTATARSTDALEKLQSESVGTVDIITADLTQKKDLQKIEAHLSSEGIKLDGVIHNAGVLIRKPWVELEDADWQSMIEVNLMAPARLTRLLLPYIAPNAHLLHIGSMGGYQGSTKFRGLAGYSTTKGALALLSECLAVELRSENISSNCLCLGAVQTEMFEEAFPGFTAPVQAPEMGRYIAEFILNGHKFYNGKVLPVALSDPE